MKKYALLFIMMLIISTTSFSVYAKKNYHYNKAKIEKVEKKDSVKPIEVVDTVETSQTDSVYTKKYVIDSDDLNDLKEFKEVAKSLGFTTSAFVIFIVLVGLAFTIIPFVVLFFIVRYIFKYTKNTDKESQYLQAQKFMDKDNAQKYKEFYYETLWQKGVRQSAIGLGLFFFFIILGIESLSAIGILIAFIGFSKLYIARDKRKNKDFENQKDNDDNETK